MILSPLFGLPWLGLASAAPLRARAGRRRHGPIRVGAMLAVGLAMLGGEANAAAPWSAKECRILKFSEGAAGGTSWKPPQVGNLGSGLPLGTVLASRTVTISSQFRYAQPIGGDPHVVNGARWIGMGGRTPTIIPTNVPGLGVRLKAGTAQLELQFGAAIPAYASGALLNEKDPNKVDGFTSAMEMELVVIGEVPAGQHLVTGASSDYAATRLEVKMTQMAPAPAMGVDIASATGVLPGSGAQCLDSAVFDVSELILVGGVQPPVVTAVCNVDARYLGYGREVAMGRVVADDFPRVGSRAGTAAFSISLSDCAANAKPKVAFYAGGPGRVPGVPYALRVDTLPGYARNLGIVLTRQGDTTPLAIGSGVADLTFYAFPGTPMGKGATANMDLEAHYQRTDHDSPAAPGVTPGPANSVVRFQLRYD